MTGTHFLSEAEFMALARTAGEPATISTLRSGQLSKNALRIRAIAEAAQRTCPEVYTDSGFESGYALLAAAQRQSADAVASVLVHPQVGTWTGECLRRLTKDVDDALAAADLAQLKAIAAAAAITAGHEFEITVPTRDGAVLLASLGLAMSNTARSEGVATVEHRDGVATVTAGGTTVRVPDDRRSDGPGWLGLRRLVSESDGLRLELDLDDIGPYRRSGHPLPATPRLDQDTVASWQRLLDQAWALLVAVDRDRAATMTRGLASLVPLGGEVSDRAEGATSRDAFGAVMLTSQPDGPQFAETLVHEFQHAKLNALLDLIPLHEQSADLFYSPARDDPRPLGGVLHGVYAYAAVADYWRRYPITGDAHRFGYAQLQFAMWREQVLRATESLLGSGRLTPHGERFVAALHDLARGWRDHHVAVTHLDAGVDAADDHHLRWRVNNLRPASDDALTLARAWLRRDPPPLHAVDSKPVPTPMNYRVSPRQQLRTLRVLEPDRFERLVADPTALSEVAARATEADLAYMCGDHRTAVSLYRRLLKIEPHDAEYWAGLALSRRRLGDDETTQVLLTRPELVRAVHEMVQELDGELPDREELAGWLSSCLDRARS